jgi:hypothetical protein
MLHTIIKDIVSLKALATQKAKFVFTTYRINQINP